VMDFLDMQGGGKGLDIVLHALWADRQEPFFERARSKGGGFVIRASLEIVQIGTMSAT
jgi:hypothetical protein